MGGGTASRVMTPQLAQGLSPRGRGNRIRWLFGETVSGSIPAWAGEPCSYLNSEHLPTVYPRVGGGTSLGPGRGDFNNGLSPRGRGNRPAVAPDPGRLGSIPAWAGEPYRRGSPSTSTGVYPRVGGGTYRQQPRRVHADGLSPRGRGNHRQRHGDRHQDGSIPAWAGEPPATPWRPPPGWVYPRVGGGTPRGPPITPPL